MSAQFDDRGVAAGTALRREEIGPLEFSRKKAASPARVLLIDVRTPAEWEASRVEGAVHVPMEEIEERADDLGLEDAELVGIICHHGVRSLRVAFALREMGHANVVSIAGGMELWSQSVDPKVPRYERNRLTGKCVIR